METPRDGPRESSPPEPTDDLLAPSLANAPAPAGPPWRLSSQFMLAFFGGALAIAVIAYLNGRRLRLDERRMRWLAIIGAVGTVVAIAAGAYTVLVMADDPAIRSRQSVRLGGRLISVVTYLGLRQVQAAGDRTHAAFDGTYASLWKPGLAAALGLGTVQAVATLLASRWLTSDWPFGQ